MDTYVKELQFRARIVLSSFLDLRATNIFLSQPKKLCLQTIKEDVCDTTALASASLFMSYNVSLCILREVAKINQLSFDTFRSIYIYN